MEGEMFSMFYFKYQPADWVKQYGLPQHHLRIVSWIVDANGESWYLIFDTTLNRKCADYRWIRATELEDGSELVQRAENDIHACDILQRCERLRCVKYSIPQKLDCESLQRFIQTGREEDRWSPQVVWTGLFASVAIACGIVAYSRNN